MVSKKIVAELESFTEDYRNGKPLSLLLDRTVRAVKKANSEMKLGPRYYQIPKEDGALAFARAAEVVLGESVEVTRDTITKTLETQERVFNAAGYTFTRYALDNFKIIYSEDILAHMGVLLNVELPRDLKGEREKAVELIIGKAKIVGVEASETQVYMGELTLRKGNAEFGSAYLSEDDKTGDFQLHIISTVEHEDEVNDLVRQVEVELSGKSIYKGAAYSYSKKEFLNDLQFGTDTNLVLPRKNSKKARAQIVNRMNSKRHLHTKYGSSKKKIVIANGEGGTGKTETAMALGAYAVTQGKTFLTYMPDKLDMLDFERFLAFAAKVGPSLVLIEDIEKIVSNDDMKFSKILELLDGVSSKNQELDFWINSNNIAAGSKFLESPSVKLLLRRFSVMIDYDIQNDATIQGLFAVYLKGVGSKWELDGEVEHVSDLFEKKSSVVKDKNFVPHPRMMNVIEAVRGYNFRPWAIRQTVDTAIAYMIDDDSDLIKEEHLVDAVEEVRELVELVDSVQKQHPDMSLEDIIGGVVDDRLVEHKVSLSDGGIVVK